MIVNIKKNIDNMQQRDGQHTICTVGFFAPLKLKQGFILLLAAGPTVEAAAQGVVRQAHVGAAPKGGRVAQPANQVG